MKVLQTFFEGTCLRILIYALVFKLYDSENSVKSIFHCNAKPLALGRCVGLDPQRDIFALDITTCWFQKSLADPTHSQTQREPLQDK